MLEVGSCEVLATVRGSGFQGEERSQGKVIVKIGTC